MEMPIRIIVTLFVAVVVGVAILTFANKMISNAKTKMHSFNAEEIEKDRIIDVTQITSTQVAALAENCYAENSGNMLESDICFAMLGDVHATASGITDALTTIDNEKVIIDLDNAKNAIKIRYNSLEDKVEITG